ncbi:MAG: DUF58 domain-containing protein [Gemmatimonadaceae bacterium]
MSSGARAGPLHLRLREALTAARPLLRVVPERRLAIVVAAAAPLWLLPGGVGVVAGSVALVAIAAFVVADWMSLPPRGGIGVTRELPPSVGIGDRAEGAFVVESRWGRAVWVRLTHELPPGVEADALPGEVGLPARGTARVPITVTGVTRGNFALGRVSLRARARLGLLAARFLSSPGGTLLVAPSVANVRRFRLLALQYRLHTAGVRALRRRGEGRAFAGLRDYVPGDDPRHVDWKATARRSRLTAREYDVEQSQTVVALIDAGRSMTQLAGAFARFEHALSASLVLADVAATAGDRVGALVFDDEVRAFVAPHRGRAALGALRGALVPVTATMVEPDYAGAFRFLATRQRRRALVVFFTDVIDVRASRALLAYVGRSAARHLVVVVALRNDELVAAAAARADRELPLYEAAAAEELIHGREEALERMRRAGVAVLDVSPQAMAAAVVNRYLEIKARGAL